MGLIALVRQYLGALDMDADTACTIGQYLNFISARAAGTAMTTAAWMRNFVTTHPEYKWVREGGRACHHSLTAM